MSRMNRHHFLKAMIARRIAIQKSKIFVAEVLDAIEYKKIQIATTTTKNRTEAIGRKMYFKTKSVAVIPSSIRIKRNPKTGSKQADIKTISRLICPSVKKGTNPQTIPAPEVTSPSKNNMDATFFIALYSDIFIFISYVQFIL